MPSTNMCCTAAGSMPRQQHPGAWYCGSERQAANQPIKPPLPTPPPPVQQAFSTAASAAPAASTRPAFSHTPAGRNHLFVPGPVNIHENVLRAMQVPGQNHRDPWFADFYKKCLEVRCGGGVGA